MPDAGTSAGVQNLNKKKGRERERKKGEIKIRRY